MPSCLAPHQRPEVNNIPEISPQIHDLPRAEADQHPHGPQGKPFHSFVGALIGVAQLLLPYPQVLHLLDDLVDRGLDAPQLRIHGLQLLRRLDGGPVARVGADIDVEFDVAGGLRAGD